MQKRSLAEILTGAVVLAVAAAFLAYAITGSGRALTTSGMSLTARFDRLTLGPETLAFTQAEIDAQIARVSPEDRAALELAADRIRAYHSRQMPQDESWGWREARLLDPSGNIVCLYSAGENRRYPAWRI